MAFLPFYRPGKGRLRVTIIGGGYAGLSALVTLLRHRADAEVTLIDPRSHHIKVTHLHETFRRPLEHFTVSFARLAERLGYRYLRGQVCPANGDLARWQETRTLNVGDEELEFDYLLWSSTTACSLPTARSRVSALSDFCERTGSELLEEHLGRSQGSAPVVSVVGGGATGIQFLFELAHYLKSRQADCRLRLIDGEDRVLKQFSADFSRYTQSRMSDLDIDYLSNTFFREQLDGAVVVEDRHTGAMSEMPSEFSLLFSGQTPERRLNVNIFGQVVVDGATLQNIFAAGDCSHFAGLGSNAMTAQSAVRKGKLAARNILRHSGLLPVLEPYLHRDLGYVVSLGPYDAVGWLGIEANVVAGTPALMIKEIVEAQYDLLLSGIDTYLI